jgi:uncharacterized protein YciI
MKKVLATVSIFIFSFSFLNAQSPDEKYDSSLAKKLHADDYGMKNYILVLLKTGSNTSVTKVAEDSIFHGHLNNIGRLARNGDLVLAGPFGVNDNNYRGLFVLNVSTFEEAKKLLNTDPAIQAKLLEPEMYLWYGSASLQEILPIHDKIQKLKF